MTYGFTRPVYDYNLDNPFDDMPVPSDDEIKAMRFVYVGRENTVIQVDEIAPGRVRGMVHHMDIDYLRADNISVRELGEGDEHGMTYCEVVTDNPMLDGWGYQVTQQMIEADQRLLSYAR